MEALLTLGLVSVILGTASGAQNIGIFGAIGVGSLHRLGRALGQPDLGRVDESGAHVRPRPRRPRLRKLLGVRRRPTHGRQCIPQREHRRRGVLGASPSGQASLIAPIFKTTFACRPSPLFLLAVMAMIGWSSFLTMLISRTISSLSPWPEKMTIKSPLRIAPRSP